MKDFYRLDITSPHGAKRTKFFDNWFNCRATVEYYLLLGNTVTINLV